MSEYINIISKEAIMMVPDWCFILALGVGILIILTGGVIALIKEKLSLTPIMIFGALGNFVSLALLLCFINFYSIEPTGQYKYEATIDKENITVSEYEEFIHTYNPEYRNGIYYWTGEEINDVSDN